MIERAEAARKLAFRGNSATWGVQARTRLSTMFVAPNAGDPTMVDVANLGGLFEYRRLRAGQRWPLLRLFGYHDDAAPFAHSVRTPLDPDIAPNAAPLVRAFCTGDQPEITEESIGGGTQFMLGPGPVGNNGKLTSIFGTVTQCFASCYCDERNQYGEQLVNWHTPAETAIVDLSVHRALPFPAAPTHQVVGRITHGGTHTATGGGETLNLPEQLQRLGSSLGALATPHLPGYGQMVAYVYERLGWNPNDFVTYRLLVRYPPIPAAAIIRFPLAPRPAPGQTPQSPQSDSR